jgi:hypothetical protein
MHGLGYIYIRYSNEELSGFYICYKFTGTPVPTNFLPRFYQLDSDQIRSVLLQCNGKLNADIDSYGFKSEDDLLKAVSMIELLKG